MVLEKIWDHSHGQGHLGTVSEPVAGPWPVPLVAVFSLSGEVPPCGPENRELVEQDEPRPFQEVASMT